MNAVSLYCKIFSPHENFVVLQLLFKNPEIKMLQDIDFWLYCKIKMLLIISFCPSCEIKIPQKWNCRSSLKKVFYLINKRETNTWKRYAVQNFALSLNCSSHNSFSLILFRFMLCWCLTFSWLSQRHLRKVCLSMFK